MNEISQQQCGADDLIKPRHALCGRRDTMSETSFTPTYTTAPFARLNLWGRRTGRRRSLRGRRRINSFRFKIKHVVNTFWWGRPHYIVSLIQRDRSLNKNEKGRLVLPPFLLLVFQVFLNHRLLRYKKQIEHENKKPPSPNMDFCIKRMEQIFLWRAFNQIGCSRHSCLVQSTSG